MISTQPSLAIVALLSIVLSVAACDDDGDGVPAPVPTASPTVSPNPTPTPTSSPVTPTIVTIDLSFDGAPNGWLADYVDYLNGQEPSIGFSGVVAKLPPELGNRSGFRLSSINRPDDIYMFLQRPVVGLVPRQNYRIDTSVTFGTDKPSGCFGSGGDPGKAVFVKAGASAEMPGRILAEDNVLRANYDKGEQSGEGRDVKILGDFAQLQPGGSCEENGPYQLKTLQSQSNGPVVRSDDRGRLWLLVGTESGYEGLSTIYYLGGRMVLTPVAG